MPNPVARTHAAGVSAPVASVGPLSKIGHEYDGVQIVAPFPGGSVPFEAQVWVSVGDAARKPVDFETLYRLLEGLGATKE